MRYRIFPIWMEATVVLLVLLLLGQGLSACAILSATERTSATTGQRPVDPEWQESGQVHLPVAQGDSPLDIVQLGFEAWLSQYAQANTPSEARLESFQLDLVEAVSDPFFAGEYDFVFRIAYSVQPSNSGFNRWMAGDGREGGEGWIIGKSHYVGVRVVNDTATIYILGPCPMC